MVTLIMNWLKKLKESYKKSSMISKYGFIITAIGTVLAIIGYFHVPLQNFFIKGIFVNKVKMDNVDFVKEKKVYNSYQQPVNKKQEQAVIEGYKTQLNICYLTEQRCMNELSAIDQRLHLHNEGVQEIQDLLSQASTINEFNKSYYYAHQNVPDKRLSKEECLQITNRRDQVEDKLFRNRAEFIKIYNQLKLIAQFIDFKWQMFYEKVMQEFK